MRYHCTNCDEDRSGYGEHYTVVNLLEICASCHRPLDCYELDSDGAPCEPTSPQDERDILELERALSAERK